MKVDRQEFERTAGNLLKQKVIDDDSYVIQPCERNASNLRMSPNATTDALQRRSTSAAQSARSLPDQPSMRAHHGQSGSDRRISIEKRFSGHRKALHLAGVAGEMSRLDSASSW
jgi:hypothetical protein